MGSVKRREREAIAKIVKRGEVALRELTLNATTAADIKRICRIQRAFKALDEAQAEYAARLVRKGLVP